MASQPLTPAQHPLPRLAQKDTIILMLRLPRAKLAGMDALVQQGLSEGELAPDQLEHLGVLTANLTHDLEQLAAYMDELGVTTGGRHD